MFPNEQNKYDFIVDDDYRIEKLKVDSGKVNIKQGSFTNNISILLTVVFGSILKLITWFGKYLIATFLLLTLIIYYKGYDDTINDLILNETILPTTQNVISNEPMNGDYTIFNITENSIDTNKGTFYINKDLTNYNYASNKLIAYFDDYNSQTVLKFDTSNLTENDKLNILQNSDYIYMQHPTINGWTLNYDTEYKILNVFNNNLVELEDIVTGNKSTISLQTKDNNILKEGNTISVNKGGTFSDDTVGIVRISDDFTYQEVSNYLLHNFNLNHIIIGLILLISIFVIAIKIYLFIL